MPALGLPNSLFNGQDAATALRGSSRKTPCRGMMCWSNTVLGSPGDRIRTIQHSVSPVSTLWGTDGPRGPYRVKPNKFTHWLSLHLLTSSSARRAITCSACSKVKMYISTTRVGFRVALCRPSQSCGCSKTSTAFSDGHIPHTALILSPSHSRKGKRVGVFPHHCSHQISLKEIKGEPLFLLKRPPLLLGLHPVFKAFLYLPVKKYHQMLLLGTTFEKEMRCHFHVNGTRPASRSFSKQSFRSLNWIFQKQAEEMVTVKLILVIFT